MELKHVFAPGGPLAQVAGELYEERPGQVAMAEAIERVFLAEKVLLVEAPTGTGKSVAYLVPALRIALSKHKKVMIVTANIALQEQLIAKDLPMLQQALPELPFTFALAKGIGNYLCLERWEKDAMEAQLVSINRGEDTSIWDAINSWKLSTQTGDLSELPMELPSKVRLALTTTADECLGKACDHHPDCHGLGARRRAQDADIIVANYHLFFADLSIKAGAETDAGILPKYDYVVMDEAHAAADIARDFFGWRVTYGQVRWATRFLQGKQQMRILQAADRFFNAINEGPGPHGERILPRISKPMEVEGTELIDELAIADSSISLMAMREQDSQHKAKLNKCSDRCKTIASHLKQVTDLSNAKEDVYYVETAPGEKSYSSIGMKPLDVAPILDAALFGSSVAKSVIGTSATLSVAGKFDFVLGQLGAYNAETLIVPSPFDHQGAAVLVVPRGLPDPKSVEFSDRVAEVVEEAIKAAHGRTLALFTSYRVLDSTYRYLMGVTPYRILKQGDMPRTRLIDEFRKDVHSVLLGTDSFWEGIDVRGESLSVVVIDRLPFEHPDDPVFQAICERDPRGWFMNYALQKSVLAFRQGFGRLIRSKTDRGAIVVCDRRIVDKPYGSRYIRSLPEGVELKRNLEAVSEILCPF